jgi:[citrate (pro-3S)-lyase] ligase
LRYVVPTLNITDRFFGEEPTNKMTRRFNNYCAIVLPKNGITTTIIKRATSNGAPISASTVREMMNKGRLDKIKEYLDGWGANFLIKKSGANK